MAPEYTLNDRYTVRNEDCPTQSNRCGVPGRFWSLLQYVVYRIADEVDKNAAQGMPLWRWPRDVLEVLNCLPGDAENWDKEFKEDSKDTIRQATVIALQGMYFGPKRNYNLRDRLVATGDVDLVYADAQDRVLGCGYSSEEADANRGSWGRNFLGTCLVQIRTALKEGYEWTGPPLEDDSEAEEEEKRKQKKETEPEVWAMEDLP